MSHFLEPLLRAPHACGIKIARSDSWLAVRLEGALDSRTRKQGLLGRESLAPDHALVIAPTEAVHTFGMRFSLDILAVDRGGVVLKVRSHVRRRRIVFAVGAFAFVEMAAGAAARAGVRAGDQLIVAADPRRHHTG